MKVDNVDFADETPFTNEGCRGVRLVKTAMGGVPTLCATTNDGADPVACLKAHYLALRSPNGSVCYLGYGDDGKLYAQKEAYGSPVEVAAL